MAEILIRLPAQLRGYVGGAESLSVEAATVAEALAALAARSSALGDRLLAPEGGLRRFVTLYRDDADIRRLQGLDTRLRGGDVLFVLLAIAGG